MTDPTEVGGGPPRRRAAQRRLGRPPEVSTTRSAPPTIRPVGLEDLEALVDIYLSSARHHSTVDPDWFRLPDRDAVRERLARFVTGTGGVDRYVGAEVGGRLVGSATIARLDDPHPGSMSRPVSAAEIGVAVLEDWRGLGIGTALIRALEDWAIAEGVEWVILENVEANPGATRLYERLGYRLDRRRHVRRLGP